MISKIIPEKEVTLYQNRLIAIILSEMEDYKNRRISTPTLKEILDTLWLAIVNELICGNTVTTPIGTFSLAVNRRLGEAQFGTIKKRFRPTAERRAQVKFKESKLLLKSIKHLLERYDAQQTKCDGKSPRERSLERVARWRERAADARVGRRTSKSANRPIRRSGNTKHD